MEKHILKNGLTVLLTQIPHVRSASIGVYSKTGASDERSDESGIAHFVEHMLFKGTSRRNAKDIASAIEGKGGELNAFTGVEQTCYYARVIDSELNTAIDVLADIYQNSVFDPNEIELEKGVVLEEIAREMDNPEGYVHSLFAQNRWKGQSYGREILGTPETVSDLQTSNLQRYMQEKCTAPNTIVTVAGNFSDSSKVLEEIEKHFNTLSDKEVSKPSVTIQSTISNSVLNRDAEQAYFCLGYDGVGTTDESRFAMEVLNTAFGSEMYSRLFQEIREKRGLAYSIGSYTTLMKHGGLFVSYGGINLKNWEDVKSIILEEMDDIRWDGLKPEELLMAKNAIVGSNLLHQETPQSIMHKRAHDEINFGRDETVDEFIQKVMAVTNNDVIDFVRTNCTPEKSSYTLICPQSGIVPWFKKLFK
jgi:predicted Zn-dependent peptidase